MAEKRFVKGLFKDTGNIDQPDGTWRHARNMVLNAVDGAISNEGGTGISGHLGSNALTGAVHDKVIGAVEISGDRTILFLTDIRSVSDLGGNLPRSEIGIYESGVYNMLFNPILMSPNGKSTNDLNFKETNPIEGTFKIDPKGDIIVYFTDDLNPPRAFNVDRQIRESGGGSINTIDVDRLYGISSTNIDNIDILNLFPYSGPVPYIYGSNTYWLNTPNQDVVKEGGGLLTGVYYLALAYVDDDLVATNFLTVSNPISIVDEYDHTRPTTKKDGAKEGSQTSKSIKWKVTNLNVNYKYVRPVVIRKKGFATEAFKLNDLEINVNSAPVPNQEITFSGIEGFSTGSVEEVIIDTISYDTAKTIQQLDNILYLGNTSGTKDIGYQKYANNIKSRSFVRQIEDFDEVWATADGLQTGFGNSIVDEGNDVPHHKSYRYIPNITNYRGYMRDEVYAFYIAFIMNDGSMSYAYHIPGREPIQSFYDDYDLTTLPLFEISSIPASTVASEALKNLSADAKLFHFYDRSWVNTDSNSHSSGARHMQFWRNATEKYPASSNFEIWDETTYVDANGDVQNLVTSSLNLTGELKGDYVRHHKMPSNANAERTTVTSEFKTDITDSTVDPTPVVAGLYTGTFKVGLSAGSYGYNCALGVGIEDVEGDHWMNDAYGHITLSKKISDSPTNVVDAWSTVYDTTSQKFTAQSSNCTVTVNVHLEQASDDSCKKRTAYHRVSLNGVSWSTVWSKAIKTVKCWACGVGAATSGEPAAYQAAANGNIVIGSQTYSLDLGDVLSIQGKGYQDGSTRHNTPLVHGQYQGYGVAGVWNWVGGHTTNSYVTYTVSYGGGEEYHDAHIKHDVNILGMHFDDIKIPAAYKDKVQGFRIYRAKRKYSNKTILGQGPIIPMLPNMGVLGLCQEALDPAQVAMASQVIQNAGLEPESFYACTAWKEGVGNYTSTSGVSTQYNKNELAYKNLQFYDFNLLRTKSSLSPATHIQVQYKTNDLTWNGPEVNQPKKMVTILSGGSSITAYTVREVWGWDNDGGSNSSNKFQNCYQRAVNSAMFIGGRYKRAYSAWLNTTYDLNRVLGQKAKSYIQGDSVFKAASLGFGGKLVNLGGNSSIGLGLANKLELPALYSRALSTQPDDMFGVWNPGFGFNLVTRSEDEVRGMGAFTKPRHDNYIVNLNAFKTDVYKNIDNQELVWTGFQVHGEDIDNFLFDDGSSFVPSSIGDFTTESINPPGSDTPGVFGGDTFIARYGVAEAYAPSDDQTDSIPSSSIMSYIVESPDNIAFRHAESDDSLYYPGSIAKDVMSVSGRSTDLNHIDNIKYNDNYSESNDIRVAFPLPLRDVLQSNFPTRTHRSAKHDTTSIIDNYRVFLGNQFKDLPKNRGDLWKLSSFNNLLYFHMEESLFAAQGKQTMKMGDASEAFVGSGDIFAQDPNELVQTEGGFGGTQSQYAALTTRFGYFFVDQASKKVFMMKEGLSEISNLGMKTWFRDNMAFKLAPYGISRDNPLRGFGFHAIYDPKYKRIILTKREVEPTQQFLNNLNVFYVPYENGGGFLNIRYNPNTGNYEQGTLFGGWTILAWNNPLYFKQDQGGWTISYYPEMSVWGSFHDYIPYIYFNTSNDFYSLTDQYPRPAWAAGTTIANHTGTTFGNAGIWKHNSKLNKGILYQENSQLQYTTAAWLTSVTHNPFEFEVIHNEYKGADVLLSSFNYTMETVNQLGVSVLEHGFTSYFVYNTFQMSGEQDLEYLINTRRIGNNWKINRFRDMAALVTDTNPYYMSPNINVTGGINTGTVTSSSTQNMFIYDGMSKDINILYLNLAKTWDLQRKFIDKWVGIRLIYNNISNNSLNLYATGVVVRNMHR